MKNNTLSKILIFATGAAAGSVVTWAVLKPKYDRLIQEELDSYKEELRKRDENIQTCEEETSSDDGEEDEDEDESDDAYVKNDYSKLVSNLGYNATSSVEEEEKEEPEENVEEEWYGGDSESDAVDPYVISHIECGECDYEIVTLMYYRDGVLAHPNGDVIDNINEVIGEESLEHFGEYEEDTVYVRNDNFEVDYVVLRDDCEYGETLNDSNTN